MALTRLTYFSENQIDPSKGSVVKELGNIVSASNRNNKAAALTGALAFDSQWFLQVLVGDRAAVWKALKRIEEDERHSNIVIVEAIEVSTRIFANWWMGVATRNDATADAFAPFLRHGLLQPQDMTAEAILTLLISLSKIGFSRQLATTV